MNFAFIVVVLAAISGLLSELLLRDIAPAAAPVVALSIMAIALIGTAWRQGKKEAPATVKAPRGAGAGESLAPV